MLACGAAAWLAGLGLALVLPVAPLLRTAFGLLFTASCGLELRAQWQGMGRIVAIRITAEGHVQGRAPDGGRMPLELLGGSLVLRRLAWFRLRFPDGLTVGELLAPAAEESEQWHVLQLLWRQCGRRLGRPLRS